MKKIFNLIAALMVVGLVLSGCATTQIKIPEGNYTERTSMLLDSPELEATQELKKFESVEELKKFLQERSTSSGTGSNYEWLRGGTVMLTASVADGDMGMEESAIAAPSYQKTSAGDYSETNIQVQGVDEADYVKNDGRYIYMIADNKLVIVDAYDAENAEIISSTEIDDNSRDYYDRRTAKEIFINDDKLVLFVEAYEKAYYFERYDIVPRDTYRAKLYVYIFDITDRSGPEVSEEFSVTGGYFQSRMIGDVVYMISQENVRDSYYINEPVIMRDSDSTMVKPEIYYFDNPEENYQFNTVTSIDLISGEVVDSKSFMLGYSNTVMVSEDNIYIAYQKQDYWRWGWYGSSQYEKERFYDIIVPLLEGELKSDIDAIISKDISEEERWRDISKALSGFYEALEDDEDLQDQYEDMFLEISDALEEYDTKKALEGRKTVVHRISIDDGSIRYKAKGEVYGSLLNQFSLDEYEGNLRLATTVDIWNKKRIQHNNVYILDENMEKIGEVTGIAEDESIYSTRFMGDRLYMVTFRQTDPFFVIDLSDPENPEILGKLKIPGFSSYLHPYDEDHIIGIGKEADESGRIGGVKIAMFDVTDVENPEEIDKVEIGERGSDSPVLYDHKAFLFSKEKGLLVLPITEISERDKLSEYRYSNSIWNGAYVFHVDADGFDQMGKVKHSSSKSDYFYWRNDATVLRSLYMDDNLYTISDKYIKINDLSGDLEELNTIKLPYDGQDFGPRPAPMIDKAIAVDVETVE